MQDAVMSEEESTALFEQDLAMLRIIVAAQIAWLDEPQDEDAVVNDYHSRWDSPDATLSSTLIPVGKEGRSELHIADYRRVDAASKSRPGFSAEEVRRLRLMVEEFTPVRSEWGGVEDSHVYFQLERKAGDDIIRCYARFLELKEQSASILDFVKQKWATGPRFPSDLG